MSTATKLSLASIIALVDSIDTNVTSYEFRRRGFVVEKVSIDTKTKKNLFLLSLSRKLIDKIAIIKDIPISIESKYEINQQSAILNEAIDILMRSALTIERAWMAHDKENLHAIMTETSSVKRVSMLCDYYGSSIGLYFGWLNNYTLWLLLPSIAGIITYSHQYFTNTIDSTYMPFFAIFVCLWGTVFLEFSKRKCAELSFQWHSYGVEDIELEKELVKAMNNDVSTQPMRLALSFSATFILIAIMFYLMLYYMNEQVHALDTYGAESWLRHTPFVMYSALPIVSPMVFEPIAKALNRFEGHATQAEAENYLILKTFLLQFVNRYSGLFYLVFFRRDLAKVRELLISLLTVGAIMNNVMELCPPYLHAIKNIFFKLKETKTNTSTSSSGSANIVPSEGSVNLTTLTESEAVKLIEEEESYNQYNLDEDYLEMVLQFGYVTMFAVAFPLTPLFALVNNYFEFFVDFNKLSNCQRPQFKYRSSIGAWQTCLQVISFVSVLTNCFLLAIVSEKLHILVPVQALHVHLDSEYGRMVAMWALEHLLLAIMFILMSIIPDVPRNIRIFQAKQSVEVHERNLENKLKLALPSPSDGNTKTEGGEEHNAMQLSSSTANANAMAASLLQQQLSHTIGYDPIKLTSLFFAPLALQSLQISPWLYIPMSILGLSYLQAEKDRADRKAAIGIVTNSSMLRLVEEELPSWIRDSEFQRVEWLNSILQQLWPHLSLAVDNTVKEQLQPVLNKNLPAVFSELLIKHCSLGSISPKILGIRVLSSSESNIRFDIEFRWAGDPLFALKAGFHLFPLHVSVSELRVSAIIRVEILNFTNTLPCFQAISITCMKKPFVDFSLKIANMDVMNFGAANYNLPTLLRHVIHSALTETALYPKKIIVPIGSTAIDLKKLSALTPVGILHLKIIKGIDLMAVNLFGGSDPYINLHSVDQTFRTTTKKLNCNPVWNEEFQVMVYDKETQEVECNVYDYDVARKNTFLGRFTVLLSKLQANHVITKQFDLVDVKGGKVLVSCRYAPLVKKSEVTSPGGKKRAKTTSTHGPDILFDLSMDDLHSNERLLVNPKEDFVLPDATNTSPFPFPFPLPPALTLPGTSSQRSTGQEAMSPQSSDASSVASVATNSQPRSRSASGRPSFLSFAPLFGNAHSSNTIPEHGQGVLTISSVKIRNLPLTAANKVYVSIKLNGNKSFHTTHIKQMKDPHFPDQFHLLIGSVADDVLTLRVMIPHKLTSPSLVADRIVPVRDLIDDVHMATNNENEQEYMLNGEVQEAYVGFKASWNAYEQS